MLSKAQVLDAINRAIATSLGWIETDVGGIPCWKDQDGSIRIPDFTSSLDSCALFEKRIESTTHDADYIDYLYRSKGLNPYVWRNHGDGNSTPAYGIMAILTTKPVQKCEAYLRTIHKWNFTEWGDAWSIDISR